MQGNKLGGIWGKMRDTAQGVGAQAATFVQEGSARAATGSQGLMQSFSLPGEAQKAAKILRGFLGQCLTQMLRVRISGTSSRATLQPIVIVSSLLTCS